MPSVESVSTMAFIMRTSISKYSGPARHPQRAAARPVSAGRAGLVIDNTIGTVCGWSPRTDISTSHSKLSGSAERSESEFRASATRKKASRLMSRLMVEGPYEVRQFAARGGLLPVCFLTAERSEDRSL
jgi:hypothetical protein